MIKEFTKELNADLSNIDSIYTKWLGKNKGLTEVEFIDTFDFDDVKDSNETRKLSTYLRRKRNSVEWTEKDYYNHYLQTGRFGFVVMPIYGKKEYRKLIQDLSEQKRLYNYIVSELNNLELNEFKSDYMDQLNKLQELQEHTKHKNFIAEFINELDDKPQKKKKGKPGRKKVEVKDAKEYLLNINLPETPESFLNFLKNQYKAPKPKTFIHIMYALNDSGYINIDNKRAYKESFEKVFYTEAQLKNKASGSQANFNLRIDPNSNSIDPILVASIKETISNRPIEF